MEAKWELILHYGNNRMEDYIVVGLSLPKYMVTLWRPLLSRDGGGVCGNERERGEVMISLRGMVSLPYYLRPSF